MPLSAFEKKLLQVIPVSLLFAFAARSAMQEKNKALFATLVVFPFL